MSVWALVLSPVAEARLLVISQETGRKIEDLAAAAVEQAALVYFRNRKDDPAKRRVAG